MSEAATKMCPFCAETIKAAATLCRFCGRELPLAGDATLPLPVIPPAAPEAASDLALLHQSEILDLLTALVQKSLVIYEQDEQGHERYRLLETVRQYSRDRLVETGAVEPIRGRHLDYFVWLAEQAEPELEGLQQGAWLDRLEREHDNLRSALVWCQSEGSSQKAAGGQDPSVDAPGSTRHDHPLPTAGCLPHSRPEAGLRLGGAVWWFWGGRGYEAEGREYLAGLLALPGAQARTAARARALWCIGSSWITRQDGMYGGARALLEESLAISRELEDKRCIARSLLVLGQLQDDDGEKRARFEESLAISRELQSKSGISSSLKHLSGVAHAHGDYGTARALLEESLAIDRGAGDKDSIAWSFHGLGKVAYEQGDYGAARALLEESLAIFRELGNKMDIALTLSGLGMTTREQGNYGEARALFRESLGIFRELSHKRGITRDLAELAAVAVAQGQPERAARLFGAAEGLREAAGAPLPTADRAGHDRSVAAARTDLSETAFAAAWAEGRAMSLDNAVAFALAEWEALNQDGA